MSRATHIGRSHSAAQLTKERAEASEYLHLENHRQRCDRCVRGESLNVSETSSPRFPLSRTGFQQMLLMLVRLVNHRTAQGQGRKEALSGQLLTTVQRAAGARRARGVECTLSGRGKNSHSASSWALRWHAASPAAETTRSRPGTGVAHKDRRRRTPPQHAMAAQGPAARHRRPHDSAIRAISGAV